VCRATSAQRVVLILVAANYFRRPHFSWIRIFLKKFLLRHANFARQEPFLQAAANFLLDSQFPWVLLFFLWRRSAARLQTLRRFLGSPTGITAASPLGIS
jgi:hypothetical protein